MRIQAINYSLDLMQSLLWQYNEATNLQGLVEQKQAWYDINQTEFWDDWFHDVFNLQSANDFGLHVWSIILNIPLQIGATVIIPGQPIFGFNENPTINSYLNFNNGNFISPGAALGFTIAQKRLLLRLRYFQLVTRGATPEINKFLKLVFSEPGLDYGGQVYVLDALDMSITYVFTAFIPAQLVLMFESYDILPRPAGVKMNFIVDTGLIFGFGNFNQNFNNGNFEEIF